MSFGFLIFPDAEELDFVGPWEIITSWSKNANGPECLMVAQTAEPVVCAKGMIVTPHATFTDCPHLDYLLVPGGMGTRREVNNPTLIQFIQAAAVQCKEVLSVCTGSFLLHRAGLLTGKRATTHWTMMGELRKLGDVNVTEARYTHDGNVWTAAGVSAGIDLALAFVAHIAGEAVAGKVQKGCEYFPDGKRWGE